MLNSLLNLTFNIRRRLPEGETSLAPLLIELQVRLIDSLDMAHLPTEPQPIPDAPIAEQLRWFIAAAETLLEAGEPGELLLGVLDEARTAAEVYRDSLL